MKDKKKARVKSTVFTSAESSSGVILDPASPFDCSRVRDRAEERVVSGNRQAAASQPTDGAGRPGKGSHGEQSRAGGLPGERRTGDQRKSQEKEIQGRKEGKSIQTGKVPEQGMRSSVSAVKKTKYGEKRVGFHSNLSFRGTDTCKEVSKNQRHFSDSSNA